MASKYPIELVRGASLVIDFTFEDEGEPIDLTGAKIIFAVKTKNSTIDFYDSDDSTALIKVEQTTHTNAADGESQITLENDDTDLTPSQYVYGVKIVPATGQHRPSSTAPFIVKPRGVEGE
jgi:hypothetical protein